MKDKWMQKALDENLGGNVTKERIANLLEFDWSEYRAEAGLPWGGLSSLEGLEEAINLKRLSLDGNYITHLEPIQNATLLEEIWLYDNEVQSVAPLKNMTKLKTLLLDSNRKLDNIDDLAACESLEYLNISNTKVTNIKVLQHLPHLKRLSIFRTPIDMNNDDNFETLKILAQRNVEIKQ